SHRTAARLHTCYRYQRHHEIEITIPHVHDHLITLARAHRTLRLPPNHLTVVDGFPVTTLARTCFDLCGDPDRGLRPKHLREIHARNMRAVVDDALARRGMTMGQLAAVCAAMCKQGRNGTVLARRIMAKL